MLDAFKTEMEVGTVSLLHNGKYLKQEDGEKCLKALNFIENDLILLQQKLQPKNIKPSDSDFM